MIAVQELDEAFAAHGFETRFKVEDPDTSYATTFYVVAHGGRELEILDAVSADGSAFEPSAFFEAILYKGSGWQTVTDALEGCETVPELVGAVAGHFN